MSDRNDLDEKLRAFLQENRPVPTPASADLEARILQGVDLTLPQSIGHRSHLAISVGIGLGLLLSWTGYRLLVPYSDGSLEAFLESSWNEVLVTNTDAETDWSLLAQNNSK